MRSRRLAVAAVHPLGAALAIAGPAGGIGLGRHELLGEALHHLPQQVRVILLCLRNRVSASKLSKATASLLSVVWTSKRLVRWSSRVMDAQPVKAKVPPARTPVLRTQTSPGCRRCVCLQPGKPRYRRPSWQLTVSGEMPNMGQGRHQSTAAGAENPCVPQHFPPASRGPDWLWGHQNRLEAEPGAQSLEAAYNRVPSPVGHYRLPVICARKSSHLSGKPTHIDEYCQCGRCDFPHFRTQNRHACHSTVTSPLLPVERKCRSGSGSRRRRVLGPGDCRNCREVHPAGDGEHAKRHHQDLCRSKGDQQRRPPQRQPQLRGAELLPQNSANDLIPGAVPFHRGR